MKPSERAVTLLSEPLNLLYHHFERGLKVPPPEELARKLAEALIRHGWPELAEDRDGRGSDG